MFFLIPNFQIRLRIFFFKEICEYRNIGNLSHPLKRTDRYRQTQTPTQTYRDSDTHTDKERLRQTHTHLQTNTHTQTDRYRHKPTHKHRREHRYTQSELTVLIHPAQICIKSPPVLYYVRRTAGLSCILPKSRQVLLG